MIHESIYPDTTVSKCACMFDSFQIEMHGHWLLISSKIVGKDDQQGFERIKFDKASKRFEITDTKLRH